MALLLLLLTVGPIIGDIIPAGHAPFPPLHVKRGYGVKGLVLWLAADNGVTSDAQGQVTALVDRTGNFTLTITGAVRGPTLVPNVLNGHPVLRFKGNHILYSPYNFGNALDHAMTFVSVAMTNSTPREEFSLYLGKNAAQGENRALAIFEGNELFDGQWVSCLGEPAVKNVFVLTGASINAGLTRATFYRNDKLIMTSGIKPDSTAPFAEVSDGVTLGAAPGPLCGWEGDIAEQLVFDRQLTPAEMQILWNTLSAKYALARTTAVSTTAAPASPTGAPH